VTKQERALFPWASAIRFGLGRLRLSPRTFWALSLPEFVALIGSEGAPAHATRQRLHALMELFPDEDRRQAAPDDPDPMERRG
jgi:uncharacterized phage protein (TIGR02216 family)